MIDQAWMIAKKLGYDEIANLFPVVFDQDFLLSILKALNYKIDSKGICFGFAHTAKHYIQTRQTQLLNDLLFKLIYLYLESRKTLLAEERLNKININEKFQLKLSRRVASAIQSWQRSCDPNEKQLYHNLIALFDGIYLYQYHKIIYKHWHSQFSTISVQETLNILTNNEKKFEYRGQFSGVYQLDEIKEYLQLISNNIEILGFSKPVSLILNTNRHAYAIAYDPLVNLWLYFDAASMPLIFVNEIEILAKKMMASFSYSKVTIFTSGFYAQVEDREKMTSLMKSLLENSTWKKIHEVTLEKTQIKSGKQHKYTWDKIASTPELDQIQDVKLGHTHSFIKKFTQVPTKIINKFTLFVVNKTYGNYSKQIDQEQTVPIYQEIAQQFKQSI